MIKYTNYILLITILFANLLLVSCDDVIWIWDSDKTKAAKKARFNEKEKMFDQSMKIKENDLDLNLNVDEHLMKISPHAANVYTFIYLKKDLNCLASDKLFPSFIEKSTNNEQIEVLLIDLQENFKNRCKFY